MAWDGSKKFGSFFSLSLLLSGSFLPFFFGQNTTAGLAESPQSKQRAADCSSSSSSSKQCRLPCRFFSLIRNHFRIDQPVRHHLWFCGPHSTTQHIIKSRMRGKEGEGQGREEKLV
jgi:hypothetical protein